MPPFTTGKQHGKKPAEDKYDFLVLLDLMNEPNELGSGELAEKYRAKTGEKISARTVRKLRAKYFFKRAKKPKPKLSGEHMAAQRTHCEKAKAGVVANQMPSKPGVCVLQFF